MCSGSQNMLRFTKCVPVPKMCSGSHGIRGYILLMATLNTKRTQYNWIYKKQRLNWLDHVERMAEDNIVQRVKRWKPMTKRPIGRPKIRWEDDVLEDIKSMNVRNWKELVQNRDSWKKVVEQARTLYRL